MGTAVKVTLVPEQMVFPGFAEMDTDGVTEELTTIVMLLDVAVVGLAHVALLVNTQVTICPLVRVVVVKVEMFVPAFTPFTFH